MGSLKAGRLVLSAMVAVILGACGGGGGGGGGMLPPAPATPSPPPPSGFPPPAPPHADGDYPAPASAEFNNNWGPGGINAQIAWQHGATGAGVIVGVIDDGVDPNHPELRGRVSPDSTDIVSGRNALTTSQSHGSELSSLIAGNYNGAQTVGVAFDATILAVRADNGSGSFDYSDLADSIDYARTHGARVINFSLGGPSPPPQAFRDAIQRATQAGIIFSVSAGNDGQNGAVMPNYPGQLAIDAIANGLIIVAGGLNPDGTINTVSNPPGATDFRYVVAPGWQIVVPDHGPAGPVVGYQSCGAAAGLPSNLCEIQGTSYASPHVAGALALLIEANPGLTPAQIVDLLLTTTDDLGPAGTDSIFGRGRLNVGRAFQPVGPLSAPLGGAQIGPASMLGAVGPAFGDGITRHSAAWSITGFDDFGRSFPVNLAGNWFSAASGPSALPRAPLLWRTARDETGAIMQMALADSVAPETMRLPIDRADLEQPAMRIEAPLGLGLTATLAAHGARADRERERMVSHLDAVPSDLSLRLTRAFGDHLSLSLISESGAAPSAMTFAQASERSATAARASFTFGAAGFDVSAGQVDEQHGVLGLVWNDAFGAVPGGETQFAGFGAHFDPMAGVRLSLSAEYGVAEMSGSGWLIVAEPLHTSAFALEARADMAPAWLDGEGALTLSLSQPLRVEDGLMRFMAPVSDAWGVQHLSYEERTFSPAPSGREVRLGLGYSYWAGDALSAFGEAIYVHEPGHVAGAEPDAVLRFGLRMAH